MNREFKMIINYLTIFTEQKNFFEVFSKSLDYFYISSKMCYALLCLHELFVVAVFENDW